MSACDPIKTRSGCPIASVLDLIGDRWTLLVIRDLMFSARHEFGQLLDAAEGIATNILSDRLKRLTQAKLVDSLPHPTHGAKKLYYFDRSRQNLCYLL